MAAVPSPADNTTELLQNLSLNSQPKPHDATEVTKKILSNEMSVSPLFRGFVDPNIGYHTSQDQTVYQGHYNGATNIWNGHSNFVNHDGVPEFTGDGYQNVYSYSPYSSYPSPSSPDPTLGQDVRPYGPHHYPYLGPFYQQPTPMSNGYGNGNSNRSSASASSRTGHQNSLLASNHSFYADQMFAFDAAPSPFQWFDGAYGGYHVPLTTSSFSSPSSFISAGNQDNRPSPHYMGFQTPRPYNQLYGQYGSTLRSSLNFESNKVNSRIYGQSMGRGNGLYNRNNPNLDEFGEMNCGPRAGHIKTPNTTIAVASVEKEDSGAVVPNKEHHNGEDLHDVYSDAKFFIIKSYSEDDIHRSIKYSVWASTPNGNKKLDAAYSESQGKASGCPVFLFFSVNASGQFVGVAEMVGPVEFDKNVDYWQHDKWIGCFPMKWHVIKDVPNNILKHIILENNDNKPVTNSRDTQEVKLEQGLEMLKIFKEHSSKTSIFDDFAFYDDRQKRMQEKKAKQLQLSNQAVDEKINKSDEKGKDDTNDKHFESVSSCENDKSQVDPEEQKPLEENHVADQVAEDALKPNN